MAYKKTKFSTHRERIDFAKVKNSLELSNLLDIQKKSYEWFIDKGIEKTFAELFPVENFSGTLTLEFGKYFLEEPRYSVKESKDRDATFACPLKVEARLLNHETGEVKEQEIFLGDMPMMTESGTFIINGAERVIVSQLVRSPSVYFAEETDKNGRKLITSKILPERGTYLEYETDAKDVAYVRIDRTRKVPITALLRAFGLSSDTEILDLFGNDDEILQNTIAKDSTKNTDEALIEIYEKLRPGEPATLDSAKNQIITKFFDTFRYKLAPVGRYKFNKKLDICDRLLDQTLAEDIKEGRKILAKKGTVVTKEILEDALQSFKGTVLFISHDRYFINNLAERVLNIENKKIISYSGNYDYFKEKKL